LPPAGPLGTLARVVRMSADAKAWLATAALLLGGGWITAMNLRIVVGALRKSGGHASLSPLLGGLLCSLALLACPVEGASSYVAVGNSLTSGFQSGGLREDWQRESYPALIAKQMGELLEA